jgi:glycosyltransferase involved in cell wall biosynthesis
MIAYNHEKYIVQAVESALGQQTSFPYEIVIGEDCSTDRTRELLVGLQQRHPDRVRLLLPEKNLGMMPNFIQTLRACRGRYIALLEGDDYWTDACKLQRQVDFLERNPDFVICYHNARVVYERIAGESHVANVNQKSVSTIEDIIRGWFMMTATIVFRREAMPAFPAWFSRVLNGDYALQLLLTHRGGKVYFLDEEMAVYRRHDSGAYSWMKGNVFFNGLLFLFKNFNAYSGFRYDAQVRRQVAHWSLELMKHNKGTSLAYWKACCQYVAARPALSRGELKKVIYNYVLPDFLKKMYSKARSPVSK